MTNRSALLPIAATMLIACGHSSPPPPPPAGAAAAATAATPAVAPVDAPAYVYVGGYRPEISVFKLDVKTGKMTPAGSVPAGKAPSFLALDPGGGHLFAVDEVDEGRVLSFTVDPENGALTELGAASSGGIGPAHVAVDRTGRWVLVANYAGDKVGGIAVLPVDDDGKLGKAVATRDFGAKSMPHMIVTDLANRFVYVPCKGGPYVAQLAFDEATGKLSPVTPDRVAAPAGSGPRHIAFHPNGSFAYVINEQALTITSYTVDQSTGKLTAGATVPTVPAAEKGKPDNSAAEIQVHPSGKFLYASNRGFDSIAIFKVDGANLTLVAQERRTIKKPRHFSLGAGLLLVANQSGDNVSVFRVNKTTGLLDPVGAPTPAGKAPSFVGMLEPALVSAP